MSDYLHSCLLWVAIGCVAGKILGITLEDTWSVCIRSLIHE